MFSVDIYLSNKTYSAVKFHMGYEKNMSFLLLPKSKKVVNGSQLVQMKKSINDMPLP